MVRFKYGPWDYRYRLYLALLQSKGLVNVNLEKKTIEIEITDLGLSIANKAIHLAEFRDYVDRSDIIRVNFGTLNARD
jgi:hypothetical protein